MIRRRQNRLEDVDGAGGEQDDGGEGDEGLDHHQGLGPAGEDGRVGGGEGGAGVEGEEEVVDEAGGPAGLAHLAAGGGVEGHLGEEEGAVGLGAAHLAGVRAAGVEPPVPGGEDEDVGEPEGAGGAEEIARAFAVRRGARATRRQRDQTMSRVTMPVRRWPRIRLRRGLSV